MEAGSVSILIFVFTNIIAQVSSRESIDNDNRTTASSSSRMDEEDPSTAVRGDNSS